MHKPSESETVIRRLYQITNDYQKGFDIQIAQLLIMGLERFNLDIAILSRVKGAEYKVLHCVTPEDVPLNVGDTFEFQSTYCQVTCESSQPVSVEYCKESDLFATHPAYQSFGLESYIGVPIFVDDEIYGTLNFSSATPYPRKFKEFDIDVLKLMASWVEVEVMRRRQQKKLQLLNEKLEYQAFNDSLTSLPNRRSLFKTLNAQVDLLKQSGGHGSLCVVDIDLFKLVNDTYGHQIGDDVLKKVANVLSKSIDEKEFVARFGGEEFVIWYPNLPSDKVDDKLDTVLKAVRSILLEGKPVTVSIGACHFDFSTLEVGVNKKSILDMLISSADECLYEAKGNGRNQSISRPFSDLVHETI